MRREYQKVRSAISLLCIGGVIGYSSAHASPDLAPKEPAPAFLSFERSDTHDDERFLELLREELAELPEQTRLLLERARHLRPQLSEAIERTSAEVAEARARATRTALDGSGGAGAGGGASGGALLAGGALALGGGAIALALGGSSGGGGSSGKSQPEDISPEEPPPRPQPLDPRDFETEEYRSNHGLAMVGASQAYAMGFTGKGVTVAVIDTGIDASHPEFEGRLLKPYNAITEGTGFGDVKDLSSHGTHVAGIIGANRNGKGMHGVAYSATIIPISVADYGDDPNDWSRPRLPLGPGGLNFGRAITHAVNSGASVINNSYGSFPLAPEDFERSFPELIKAYDRVVEKDVIMVAATGNESLDTPSSPAYDPVYNEKWKGYWVAVGALDPDGQIASYSNKCGIAAEWCLFAPGSSINSTVPDGGYQEFSGTSMATPMVAGGIALLREAFPYLEAPEITSLLFETADDMGDRDTYGHGKMNLERAFQPVGTLAVPLGADVDDRKLSLRGSSLNVSPAFGDGIGQALEGHRLIALDKYKRAFEFDLGNFVTSGSPDQRRDALHRLQLFGGIEERSIHTYEAGPFSITTASRLRATGPGLGQSPYSRMTFELAGTYTKVSASLNPDLGRSFGLREVGFGRAPLMAPDSFDQPHLALMKSGLASNLDFALSERTSFQIAAFAGRGEAEEQGSFVKQPSMFGGVGQLTITIGDGMTFQGAVGAVSEEGALLGSISRGAFGEDMRSDTLFANLGMTLEVAPDTQLTFAAAVGQSSFRQEGGLIRSGEGIVTTSFGVGAARHSLFQEEDVFSLAVSQPLRVEAGKIDLSVPTQRNMDGSIGYSRLRLSPQPSGREIALQASYGFKLMGPIEAAVGALHRLDAGHVKGARETIGMVSASLRF